MECVEKIVGKHFVGVIHPDTDVINPMDDFDFIGKLYVPNNRHLSSSCTKEYFDDAILKIPVYMYEHSGVAINTTGFSCPWDSGQIGWICSSAADILYAYGRKRISNKLLDTAHDCLVSEVETINQWLTGEVYGYTIHELINEDDEPPYDEAVIDSCWGFYGLDWCRECLVEEINNYDKHYRKD